MNDPYWPFYAGDFLRDQVLQDCSKASHSVWLHMMCLMHDSTQRGALVDVQGRPWSNEKIAEKIPGSLLENLALFHELMDAKIFSRDENGAVISRRMVRQRQLSEKRAASGKKGMRNRYGNKTDNN
jgi:hypothetical protein